MAQKLMHRDVRRNLHRVRQILVCLFIKTQQSFVVEQHDCKCSKLFADRSGLKARFHGVLNAKFNAGESAAGLIEYGAVFYNADDTGKIPVFQL